MFYRERKSISNKFCKNTKPKNVYKDAAPPRLQILPVLPTHRAAPLHRLCSATKLPASRAAPGPASATPAPMRHPWPCRAAAGPNQWC
jgi:hypothetical protein